MPSFLLMDGQHPVILVRDTYLMTQSYTTWHLFHLGQLTDEREVGRERLRQDMKAAEKGGDKVVSHYCPDNEDYDGPMIQALIHHITFILMQVLTHFLNHTQHIPYSSYPYYCLNNHDTCRKPTHSLVHLHSPTPNPPYSSGPQQLTPSPIQLPEKWSTPFLLRILWPNIHWVKRRDTMFVGGYTTGLCS